jgi:hypothetical protein
LREVVAAHLLAHGLVQHGFSPRSYSPFKMVADLLDLGVGGPGGPDLVAAACRWLPPDRWGIDTDAVVGLCRALASGDESLFAPEAVGSAARRLLDHCLAGPLDPHYRRLLKVRKALRGGTPWRRSGALRRSVRSALFLSRREIDAHYGSPTSAWGYIGYRLLWPLEVVFKALPSAAWGAVRSWRLGRR